MKKVLLGALFGAAVGAVVVWGIYRVGGHGSTPVIHSNDSGSTQGSPPGNGSTPKYVISNPVHLPAGSSLYIECASEPCPGLSGVSASDTNPGPVNPKLLFDFKIPYELPAGTRMSVSFRPAPEATTQLIR
jgi:hypothetical protein